MANDYDAIIIGSGFGGAVLACRLAERGRRVLVLERGRRWKVEEYPSLTNRDWIYDHERPETRHGWMDLRLFRNMAVAMGAGVGGGSLIYANVSVEAEPQVFDRGWPAEITRASLQPYYDRVGSMLNVQTLPATQATRRYELMQEAAGRIGAGPRFRALPLAVSFDPQWTYASRTAGDYGASKTWTNAQGQAQGTCVHCGNCDIGCPVKAKNTLDLNYLPLAEQHGAEIRPLHIVTGIAPEAAGYRVRFDGIRDGRRIPGSLTATQVVLAAGSLGSTELLLRCRDEQRTLPGISARLGWDWSSNGDFLTPASYGREILPTQGPTITSAIDFLDGSQGGQRFFIEDGGFPDLLANLLDGLKRSWLSRLRHPFASRALGHLAASRQALAHVMPWFAQGIDASNGRLRLGRDWWWPWQRRLKLDWQIKRSEGVMNAIVAMHQRLSAATGGAPMVPPTWSWFKYLATPHPLGGCNMGTSKENGVVDHLGQVFGYPNLIVADGSIVPEAVGLNPSRTIAALAERIAERVA